MLSLIKEKLTEFDILFFSFKIKSKADLSPFILMKKLQDWRKIVHSTFSNEGTGQVGNKG